MFFLEHKKKDTSKNSFHLIVDEAHNILSETSSRESETWKDYRLELFEEIIKEGRNFHISSRLQANDQQTYHQQ
jgi:Rad3-related DNA helicase